MNTLDNLNRELEDFGFQINGNEYLYEKVTYQDIFINGQHLKQPQKSVFRMEYLGEGCELVDSSDSDCDHDEINNFFTFNIIEDGEIIGGVCISNIDDLKFFIGL